MERLKGNNSGLSAKVVDEFFCLKNKKLFAPIEEELSKHG